MTVVWEIAQLGNAVLRQNALPVEFPLTSSIKSIINTMLALMKEGQGVGIAAPQIEESLQIIVVASNPTPRYPKAPQMEPVVMINPSFSQLSDETDMGWEGCLSIPGIRAKVPRLTSIEVTYFCQQSQQHKVTFTDFVARVFQHEYDHLQGMVYLDRVVDNRDIVTEKMYLRSIDAA
ncbi:MAG: peptide deformylase [Methylococcaceae bacterium]